MPDQPKKPCINQKQTTEESKMTETSHPLLGRTVKYRRLFNHRLETGMIQSVTECDKGTLITVENGFEMDLSNAYLVKAVFSMDSPRRSMASAI